MVTFQELLKKKGIGATMGKQLQGEDFDVLSDGFRRSDIPLATKSTLLIALLALEPNDEEKAWLETSLDCLPGDLEPFLEEPTHEASLLNYTRRAIKGMSLSYEECKQAAQWLFEDGVPDFHKSAFLESLRLKRETLDENLAFLDAFWELTRREESELPVIIDIANAYDGFNRHLCLAPFIAATLGKLGLPTLLHGVEEVAPKRGVTAYKVIKALGLNPEQNAVQCCKDLKEKGWAYMDQSYFFPELFKLQQLRTDMVKRPVLATVEKFLQPIRARHGNVLVTGYTHPAYRDMTSSLLSTYKQASQFVFFRGTEGSAQLNVDRRAPYVHSENEGYVSPEDLGFKMWDRIEPDYELTVDDSVRQGLHAMEGKPGLARDIIAYNCLAICRITSLAPDLSIDDIHFAMSQVTF